MDSSADGERENNQDQLDIREGRYKKQGTHSNDGSILVGQLLVKIMKTVVLSFTVDTDETTVKVNRWRREGNS